MIRKFICWYLYREMKLIYKNEKTLYTNKKMLAFRTVHNYLKGGHIELD